MPLRTHLAEHAACCIVTQAGGHVQIYTEPGLGTTFTVLLPATEAAMPEPSSQTRDRTPGGGETILVSRTSRDARGHAPILGANGYTVLTAGQGTDALRIAAEHTTARSTFC